ncbi:hypothetical protein NW767_015441 [Fusarium falciforme]|uniref:Uncharacterized protein n=1 Tax=Fusarium falciforme TaxID=195108 RepID=A0A9W8QV49_9HYPO|nr:hypothetical protein NW767_015441 [Fusarium falciforme]KAJ4177920.1 hypothetical protein NW755_013563 [Fusarium falciforme]KAJ4181400.1 hypothetical protein NW759_017195 [Fusarium solani]
MPTWSYPPRASRSYHPSPDLSELNIIWNLLAVLEVSQTTPAATACLYFPRAQSKQAKTRKRNARPFLWLLAAIFPVSATDIGLITVLTIQSGKLPDARSVATTILYTLALLY